MPVLERLRVHVGQQEYEITTTRAYNQQLAGVNRKLAEQNSELLQQVNSTESTIQDVPDKEEKLEDTSVVEGQRTILEDMQEELISLRKRCQHVEGVLERLGYVREQEGWVQKSLRRGRKRTAPGSSAGP
ncbi:hypothetical protein BU23DRAFT_574402 [Bimuria novae-zelandiae CBS 107.79]|uniref:Uncharacterized protein n=1 Tax=Bimuria novae-zelandiae CBS 107.79 TaxID=1447943 RepID=A0A6A5UMU2_9PLEO|nr:hypothetical protein BU23DRAFT_574402 [Bimuria novae-zelandiae CBS 107.79]